MKLLAGEIEEEGAEKVDKDAKPNEVVVDAEKVVPNTELASVELAVSLG